MRIALLLWASVPILAQSAAPSKPFTQTVNQNGTRVTLNIERVDQAGTASEPLREFENVRVQVVFMDAASHSPQSGGSPAAWLDRKDSAEPTTLQQCVGKVQRFAEGSTFSRTELDLTSYFVVVMNADATLTVADPRFGYGDTRLLAMVPLDAPAEDWAVTGDGKRLYVTLPLANEVAVIDTASWRVVSKVTSIPRAGRIALQPDEAYVWVGFGAESDDSGVAALRTSDMSVAARVPTGRGYHHIAVTADSAFAFVTNPAAGSVSVIDVRALAVKTTLALPGGPQWIAYSDLAKAAYVATEGTGVIAAIDANDHKIRATMNTAKGLGQIRFAPGGRYALAVNPVNDMIYVVDAASNRIVQRAKLENGPDQIAFTNKTAHIRLRRSDTVLMIALASLGRPDTEISPADFPAGRHSPAEMTLFTPADGIVQASGENAVLVANPGDKAVYLYMEGSAAPMGNLSNYGHEPRSVMSVDRNLRERGPGVYETTAMLPAAGTYDLALFLNSPRVVSCFQLSVASDPSLTRRKPAKRIVEPRIAESASAGPSVHLAFRITFADAGKPDSDVKDVVILMAGPSWQRRELATHRGDGIYAVDFNVPTPGVYSVFLTSQSLGLPPRAYQIITIREASH